MWHSPVFTSIRAKRIPAHRFKKVSVLKNCEIEVYLLSQLSNRSLHLIKFILGIVTDIIIFADSRKQTSLTSEIS
jgi:hypothetical protein